MITEILLTALSPVSHHDPAVNDGSNTLTFLRHPQIVNTGSGELAEFDTSEFCIHFGVPSTVSDIFGDVGFADFVSVSLVRHIIEWYGTGNGTGLFSGINRYDMLASRLRSCATRANTLRGFYDTISRDLQLGVPPIDSDILLMHYFRLPQTIQIAAIDRLSRDYTSIISIARYWQKEAQRMHPAYATATGLPLLDKPLVQLVFETPDGLANQRRVVRIPAISANSVRHQMFRSPLWAHLTRLLGLTNVELPPAVEGIFVNGGNIKAGVKPPSSTAYHATMIRQKFPSLDLLGGVTNSFDLGESALNVHAWLVCKENATSFPDTAMRSGKLTNTALSAFDMLDNVTATRQATRHGDGQMIYNFETLIPGTQFYVRATCPDWTGELTMGALAAAVNEYNTMSKIGGQSARGYGLVDCDVINSQCYTDALEKYEKYLTDNKDALIEELVSGHLGAEIRVCS